jgi:glutamine synthetase
MNTLEDLHEKCSEDVFAKKIAQDLMPQSFAIAELCNRIEEVVPDELYPIPKFYDMLFIR